MKKLLALAIGMIAMNPSFIANAQEDSNSQSIEINEGKQWSEKKHQLSVSYGGFSTTSLEDEFGIGTLFNKNEKYEGIGTFNIGYGYTIKRYFNIGLDVSYEHGTITNKEKNTEKSLDHATIMPRVRIFWFHKSNISMYSKLGFGAKYTSRSLTKGNKSSLSDDELDPEWHTALQLTLVGAEVGGQNFRGFSEFGFGQQGIIQAGIRYAF